MNFCWLKIPWTLDTRPANILITTLKQILFTIVNPGQQIIQTLQYMFGLLCSDHDGVYGGDDYDGDHEDVNCGDDYDGVEDDVYGGDDHDGDHEDVNCGNDHDGVEDDVHGGDDHDGVENGDDDGVMDESNVV